MLYVYLSAPGNQRKLATERAQELARQGFGVTSRWLNVEPDCRPAEFRLADVLRSDLLIACTEKATTKRLANGVMHAEFGAALAGGKHVWLAGPGEHDLHYHPRVKRFSSWTKAVAGLAREFGDGDYQLPELRTPALEQGMSTLLSRIYHKVCGGAVEHANELSGYVPLLRECVAVYLQSRLDIARVVMSAWEEGGCQTGFVNPGEATIGGQDFATAEAVSAWFEKLVQLAKHESHLDAVNVERASIMATLGIRPANTKKNDRVKQAAQDDDADENSPKST